MGLGYDKIALNRQLLLHLTLEEMLGVLTYDRAKPAHEHILGGVPTWNSLANGLPYLDFNPVNPDQLACQAADATDLDFGNAGNPDAFSMVIWVYIDDLSVDRALMCHGQLGVAGTGWDFHVSSLGAVRAAVNQAGGRQSAFSGNGEVTTGRYMLLGLSFDGNWGVSQASLFGNGRDISDYAAYDVFNLPDTAVANRLYIGIRDAGGGGVELPIDGRIAGGPCGPRIWGGRALSPAEHRQIFQLEKHWLGV